MSTVIIAVVIVALIGLIAGLGLSVCSVLMEVKGDPIVAELREALPGANCGACGYSGCDGYAEALSGGAAKPGLCSAGGKDVNEKLAAILGVAVTDVEKKAAFVHCCGTTENTSEKMIYKGVKTCKAANMQYGGPSACIFGCIGLGDCASVCDFGAVKVTNGKAEVDRDLCIACGKCVKACPKGIIELLPVRAVAAVQCTNRDKGAVARKSCKVACIGCGKCERACEQGAVKVENNVAVIDTDKCIGCGKCVEGCPSKCLVMIQ